jgi:Outer membrane protein beta-barrel domain
VEFAGHEVLVHVDSLTRNWRYCLVILLLAPRAGSAQLFSAGAKAGVPVSNFLEAPVNIYTAYTYRPFVNRYIVGATVELRLPLGFGVEVDALYRHFGYSGGPSTVNKTTTGDWEFPVLVKYRLPGKTGRPFVDAGLAVDTLSGSTQAYGLFLPDMFITNTTSQPNELQNQTILGFVAGGGFDLHVWHLHFLPELRYTRWKDGHFLNSQPTVLTSNRNQVEFLLGITF